MIWEKLTPNGTALERISRRAVDFRPDGLQAERLFQPSLFHGWQLPRFMPLKPINCSGMRASATDFRLLRAATTS